MKIKFSFLLLFISIATFAQEFNATVTVNAEQTGRTKLSVFKTLEGAVQDLINQNNWTDKDLESYEKIDCNFFINVSQYSSDSFTATIQVQASRPVYGSTTSTPIFNFKDNQFNFRYTEFQPLDYNPNTYSSNLVSTISFYLYTILGIDGDTFAPMGGENYHQEAKLIVNTAQGRSEGWQPNDGNQSRFRLNADFLSNNFSKYREALYIYHREGLDVMYEDVKAGKQKIVEAIQMLREVNNSRPNSILMRSFFDAKNNEITRIFSGGPKVDLTEVLNDLKRIAPLYNKKWNTIKN
ncbi:MULTISPECIES: type IX secretion system protein PorD [Mesonia]|uniref:Uncharacterized protein n=1 Tax=Mesonia oceanica TaxID=2687242 RepID=A0AC61YCY1_9FLAO|nr:MULTISPECIES: DUF4835 family protein [Mesonia]MAN29286.1 DUF4835 domain-containing protein [Mesonia sp.]MAQ39890.1 DUF4835 domain-containing protein [Mesonia sp.]MBJ99024.1 DUF4835 domain-containing protein [Flavobacteriaceae bacterium]VVV02065.1 hypothetical protein FVB9532_03361 [Mesonia oceanica]|tara:strand:- start:7423 stop:8307 length:885 start_codon:yes stop_codon:yes gene_type:complete